MINMISKKGSLNDLYKYFKEMEFYGFKPDIVGYNAILKTTLRAGDKLEIGYLLDKFKADNIKWNIHTYGIWIRHYMRKKDMVKMNYYRNKMLKSGFEMNMDLYHLFFYWHFDHCEWQNCYHIFNEMQAKGFYTNARMYYTMAQALWTGGQRQELDRFHERMTAVGIKWDQRQKHRLHDFLEWPRLDHIRRYNIQYGRRQVSKWPEEVWYKSKDRRPPVPTSLEAAFGKDSTY